MNSPPAQVPHESTVMGTKVWPKHIEAEVTFLPTEAGGRKSHVMSGYRPQFFYDGQDHDAVQFYPDVEQVRPGDTVRVWFSFVCPDKHAGKLAPGKIFLIREGTRVVAYGKIIRLLDLAGAPSA